MTCVAVAVSVPLRRTLKEDEHSSALPLASATCDSGMQPSAPGKHTNDRVHLAHCHSDWVLSAATIVGQRAFCSAHADQVYNGQMLANIYAIRFQCSVASGKAPCQLWTVWRWMLRDGLRSDEKESRGAKRTMLVSFIDLQSKALESFAAQRLDSELNVVS